MPGIQKIKPKSSAGGSKMQQTSIKCGRLTPKRRSVGRRWSYWGVYRKRVRRRRCGRNIPDAVAGAARFAEQSKTCMEGRQCALLHEEALSAMLAPSSPSQQRLCI